MVKIKEALIKSDKLIQKVKDENTIILITVATIGYSTKTKDYTYFLNLYLFDLGEKAIYQFIPDKKDKISIWNSRKRGFEMNLFEPSYNWPYDLLVEIFHPLGLDFSEISDLRDKTFTLI